MRLGATKASATTSYNGLGDQLYDLGGARPTLDLNFSSNESLVDSVTGKTLVDHTRQSSATYVDGDGVIRTAVTNLLLQSEDFSTTWTSNNYSLTGGFIAPDGTTNATKIVRDATSTSASSISQNVGSVSSSTNYTYSVYAKAEEYSKVSIREGASTGAYLSVDLSSATVIDSTGAIADETVDFVGNGWYRISFRLTTGASQTTYGCRIYALPNSYTTGSPVFSWAGDGTSGIYLWGAQLEESSTVGQYVKTTTAINSAPRFDHDPTTGESLGLLVEESRQNLLLRSENFSDTNPDQITFRGDVTADQAIAPNGTLTADSFLETTDTGNHIVQCHSHSYSSGTTYTYSVFLKPNGRDTNIRVKGANTTTFAVEAYFDLTGSGSVASVVDGTAQIQSYNNGWYRCILTGASNANAVTAMQVHSSSSVGDATKGLYLWGAQLEAGSFATSYIPTEGSTVTRAADVASITGTNFSSWYEQSEGTILAAAQSYFPGTQNAIATIFNSASGGDNRYSLRMGNTLVTSDGVQQAQFNPTNPVANTDFRLGFAYRTDDIRFAPSYGVSNSDTSATLPLAVNTIEIGKLENFSTLTLNGTIRRLTYWPSRLSNDTLQTITT
jgi:hypothetical protein